jgi:hypothetical protein
MMDAATQAVARLRRDAEKGIKGQAHANAVHEATGAAVRQTIKNLGGVMPAPAKKRAGSQKRALMSVEEWRSRIGLVREVGLGRHEGGHTDRYLSRLRIAA